MPLGMNHTALRPDSSDNEWVAARRDNIAGYHRWARLDVPPLQYAGYPTGWAVGTISDMVRFARALIPDENGTSVLFENPETMRKLYPTHEEIQYSEGYVFLGGAVFVEEYGVIIQRNRIFNGFFVFSSIDDSNRVVGHSGQVPGFMSHMLIDIDTGAGLVIVENMQFGLQTIHAFTQGLKEIVFRKGWS
jgi:CubicO group peptidase (beta-lactamase class C family)